MLKLVYRAFFFYLSLVLCAEVDSALFNLSLHKPLNSSLLKRIFNVHSYDPPGKVPEYEVTRMRFLAKRSTDEQDIILVHLSAFGKDIRLRLQRNEDFSDGLKVFEGQHVGSTIRLDEILFEDEDSGTPYVDTNHMAAITIRHGLDGKLQMEGVIGDGLLIKPAPTHINFLADHFASGGDGIHLSEKYANETYFGRSSSDKSGVHIVYKSLTKTKTSLQDSTALDGVVNDINPPKANTNNRKRPSSPLHAWVEVLLLVDFDTYTMHKSHGLNDTQIRRYYVSFLNGVDLRFKALSDPKINLILSQIIIFKSLDATPYLKTNLYPNRRVFNGNKAIDLLARHMYKAKQQSVFPDFDVAVLLTNLNMCTENIFFCNTDTVGLAYYMGACTAVENEERWMGVAIVEDNGGFDGILTAAHEIGHLLGADDDGARRFNPDVPLICSHEEGYIMSHKSTSERIFQWSECSIGQFRRFLSSGKSSCLFNNPIYDNELVESELPGTILSLDEQCKRFWGTGACAWDSRVCVSLHCYNLKQDTNESCTDEISPAAEGSFCGENLHCRHGKCVSKSLTYSPAWNMAPRHDGWKYINSTRVDSAAQPSVEEDCVEDESEFCENYFSIIGHHEACKNSRIIEECCYSRKVICASL